MVPPLSLKECFANFPEEENEWEIGDEEEKAIFTAACSAQSRAPTHVRQARQVQTVVRILKTQELESIRERLDELEKRIDQRSREFAFTQISSLGIPDYAVQKPIPVTICQDGDEFTATFFDANISTGGDTEQEAVANLQSLIADFYDDLVATPDEKLGPSLRRQKLVLVEFLCRT